MPILPAAISERSNRNAPFCLAIRDDVAGAALASAVLRRVIASEVCRGRVVFRAWLDDNAYDARATQLESRRGESPRPARVILSFQAPLL